MSLTFGQCFFQKFCFFLIKNIATMKVVCLTSDVVLFSIDYKTLDISQDSVATHLIYAGIFSDCITNFLLIR